MSLLPLNSFIELLIPRRGGNLATGTEPNNEISIFIKESKRDPPHTDFCNVSTRQAGPHQTEPPGA